MSFVLQGCRTNELTGAYVFERLTVRNTCAAHEASWRESWD